MNFQFVLLLLAEGDGMTDNQLSSFLPLVLLLSCSDVSDRHSPFPLCVLHLVLMSVWLKANQSVCTHEMSSVCLVTEKGFH